MQTYTVHLLGLKCIQSQENAGDEIYITFNREKIWQTWERKMHKKPHDIQFDEFDFEKGRLHDHESWKKIEPFEPEDYIFRQQTRDLFFEIWDADLFLGDDYLGRAPVSVNDAAHGTIQAVCRRDGAHYTLTYRVELD